MKRAFFLIGLLLVTFFFKENVFAKETIECSNRYAILVNPIRGRNLWVDKTITPLKAQYNLIKQYNFPATWLLQYDTLQDLELIDEINNFNSSQEKGVFLEISQKYADESRVIYPYNSPWFSPNAVFLSGYSQSDRRRLIDKLFKDFKSQFGYYPLSVGAWWIDSYSLNYMKENYDIKAAMIVADQKTTDNYGVWGAWWGVPFYPSKANILTPATNLKNKQDIVVIQWAQRDPMLAIGDGPKFSNYSLQANDYIRQGKKTDYFQSLIDIYLNCQNPLGQVTIGLETGSDSVVYFEEYAEQLEVLKNIPSLRLVKMEEFYDKFNQAYKSFPKKIIIESGDTEWIMTPEKRFNNKQEGIIEYNPEVSFEDYFIAKQDDFLNRILPYELKQANSNTVIPPSIVSLLILGAYSFLKKKLKVYFSCVLFLLASFGLILRSGYQFGWWVYYGPVLQPLYLYQAFLPVVSFLIFLFLERFKNLNLWFLPLAFAVDPLIQSFRVSFISEKYYIGFLLDALRFVGVSIEKNYQFGLINIDLPGYLAAGLIKFDFAKIWRNEPVALLIYPLAHILLAILLSLIFQRSFKLKKILIAVITFIFFMHLSMVFTADPFTVQLSR